MLLAGTEDSVLVAVLSVLGTGAALGIAAALVKLIKGWGEEKRANQRAGALVQRDNERDALAKAYELLDIYKENAVRQTEVADRYARRVSECEEDRARLEEWAEGMQAWALHRVERDKQEGKDPGPVPRLPPRRHPPADEHDQDDYDRRTAAQTAANLKALTDKTKEKGA